MGQPADLADVAAAYEELIVIEDLHWLVINADDFGISRGVNEAIADLLASDAISSTTLMMCERFVEEGVERYGKELSGRAGVHLQLTGYKPLLARSVVPSLYDEEGNRFRKKTNVHLCQAEDVYAEWVTQLSRAALLGIEPTHIDTHHCVHLNPQFLDVYLQIAKERNLPVRGDRGVVAEKMGSRGVCGTTVIIRGWTGSGGGEGALLRALEEEKERNQSSEVRGRIAVEVIAHPGYVDEYLQQYSSLNTARVGDYEVLKELCGFDWAQLRYNKVSHRDLCQP